MISTLILGAILGFPGTMVGGPPPPGFDPSGIKPVGRSGARPIYVTPDDGSVSVPRAND